MGKRRNTAKTGDKAIYKNKGKFGLNGIPKGYDKDEDDDPIYDAVDRYHNQKEKEFLRLDGASDPDDDDEVDQVDAVMDLAGDVEESSDDYHDDDSDDDESLVDYNDLGRLTSKTLEEDEDAILSSSDDDDNDESDIDNAMLVRSWGTKKSAYYSGGDAELHDKVDDGDEDADAALLEEKAAKEVQASRFKDMDEGDFLLSDTEDDREEKDTIPGQDTNQTEQKNKMTKVPTREQQKYLERHHPEMLPLLSHFTPIVRDVVTHTSVATKALLESSDPRTAESVGATPLGQQYLLTKTMLQSAAAMNLSMYLLLKKHYQQHYKEGDSDIATNFIQTHPVMNRLQMINSLLQMLDEKVEGKVEGLREQVDSIVRATSLLNSEGDKEDVDIGTSEEDEAENDDGLSEDDENIDTVGGQSSTSDGDEESSKSAEKDDEDMDNNTVEADAHCDIMNEAKFGLRPNELAADSRRMKESNVRVSHDNIDNDDDNDDYVVGSHRITPKEAMKKLSATVNAIEQRIAARTNRLSVPQKPAEHLDDHDDGDEENAIRRGLEMMEAELGRLSDDDEEDSNKKQSEKTHKKNKGSQRSDDGDRGSSSNDFYRMTAEKSHQKKRQREAAYAVEPQFPKMDHIVAAERPISRQILKNRGLVAHKNKLNRNPRVKKREQFRKALIKRRGTVREVRPSEADNYGGEVTGINTNISRSRKL